MELSEIENDEQLDAIAIEIVNEAEKLGSVALDINDGIKNDEEFCELLKTKKDFNAQERYDDYYKEALNA